MKEEQTRVESAVERYNLSRDAASCCIDMMSELGEVGNALLSR